ncbi:MAG TPA: hypothetical protein VIE88_12755 [Vicinamibacteria bacterium]|jgi:hypothetical protein
MSAADDDRDRWVRIAESKDALSQEGGGVLRMGEVHPQEKRTAEELLAKLRP